jgi:hypothetical protein
MKTRVFQTWIERLDAGTLTHSQILQAGRVISAHALRGSIPGGRRTSLTYDEAQSLFGRLGNNPVRLYPDHEQQGFDWLVRRGQAELEGMDDAVHDSITDRFDHFEWDGRVEIDGNWPYVSVVPVWTVVLGDGRRYRYYFASGWRDDRGNKGRLWLAEEASA